MFELGTVSRHTDKVCDMLNPREKQQNTSLLASAKF